MTENNKELNFETTLSELERLVHSLESDNLSLDQSLATFEQGVKLSRSCQQALEKAEQKVSILLGNTEQPFEQPATPED